METTFHLHLAELETRTGFQAILQAGGLNEAPQWGWQGGLVHARAPAHANDHAQRFGAVLMTLIEATVQDQIEAWRSDLSRHFVQLVAEKDDIDFRYD